MTNELKSIVKTLKTENLDENTRESLNLMKEGLIDLSSTIKALNADILFLKENSSDEDLVNKKQSNLDLLIKGYLKNMNVFLNLTSNLSSKSLLSRDESLKIESNKTQE